MSTNSLGDRCFYFKKLDPSVIVIFGASGDLAKRKLIPSLFRLSKDCSYSDKISIVGFARSGMDQRSYVEELKKYYDYGNDEGGFLSRITYYQGEYDKVEDFTKLRGELHDIDLKFGGKGNRLFYLSVPPTQVESIVSNLKETGNIPSGGVDSPWGRVVIEKPFGYNLETAVVLNSFLEKHIREDQTYRIDHYLGKETVQNILMCRFANTFFEPVFNNKFVESVEITVSEELGVESRGGYFDKVGILRDMIQNHLFQLLALVAMEYPASFTAKSIHDEKAKLFAAIRKIRQDQVDDFAYRAQYDSSGDLLSYKNEKGISKDSNTETFAAVKLYIDNLRWAGVPFYLRSGKRLAAKKSVITVSFKNLPNSLFEGTNISNISNNHLHFRIQPEEGISLCVNSKVPGYDMTLKNVDMDFSYKKSFEEYIPEAYERLLFDALIGDMTLFNRKDEIEESWKFFDPIVKVWESSTDDIDTYPALGEPPIGADEFVKSDEFKWQRIVEEC